VQSHSKMQAGSGAVARLERPDEIPPMDYSSDSQARNHWLIARDEPAPVHDRQHGPTDHRSGEEDNPVSWSGHARSGRRRDVETPVSRRIRVRRGNKGADNRVPGPDRPGPSSGPHTARCKYSWQPEEDGKDGGEALD